MPLKLYNNYVRWVSVYVQYLKADGTNLSLDPDRDVPRHPPRQLPRPAAAGLHHLGVPIWDTNTIDVTLDFPPEATSARLLFCGLGDNAVGRRLAPVLPGRRLPQRTIAPSDEVLVASLLTGSSRIGLTAFALLIDIDVAATLGAASGRRAQRPRVALRGVRRRSLESTDR